MSENRGQAVAAGGPISFERLEVFQRAYRISLDVHRVSLGFPDIEQRALADSDPSREQIDLRELSRRIWKAVAFESGVPTLCRNGVGFCR
jgi:hypothetical protein